VRNSRQLAERVHAMRRAEDDGARAALQSTAAKVERRVSSATRCCRSPRSISGKCRPGRWRIVTYTSKWVTGSTDDVGGKPRCPARLPAKVAAQVRSVALRAWKLAGGCGYGRVDMRIDDQGRPWILEVNANPDIAPMPGWRGWLAWRGSNTRRSSGAYVSSPRARSRGPAAGRMDSCAAVVGSRGLDWKQMPSALDLFDSAATAVVE
jgi:hypothetical protein